MPQKTFNNLPDNRQEAIRQILLTVFTDQPVSQVKVSQIVTALGMSRGIFYKYFENLQDAYHYLITYYAGTIHGTIIQAIMKHQDHFFEGIETFLLASVTLEKGSSAQRQIQLLTQNSALFSHRLPETHGFEAWKTILSANDFQIESDEEAKSFLYFVMHLVIETLIDASVNDWTPEQLVTDYRYKVKWLLNGLNEGK
ncbi:TetR/AcrR family transcriptional regulator [Pediococcus parvulus]|uniref:TetR/AcrR family transcriptional regulator n=1 Tax=Pediococcus parvulus TaxID=54062 RepID=UPI00375694FD